MKITVLFVDGAVLNLENVESYEFKSKDGYVYIQIIFENDSPRATWINADEVRMIGESV